MKKFVKCVKIVVEIFPSLLGNRNIALSHYDMVMISESDKLDHRLKVYVYTEKLYIFSLAKLV